MVIRRRALLASQSDSKIGVDGQGYLTIIPTYDGKSMYTIFPYSSFDGSKWNQEMPFYYRINGGEWIEVDLGQTSAIPSTYITLNNTDVMQLKCNGCDFKGSGKGNQYFNISCPKTHNVSGTPMSLLYGDYFRNYDTTCARLNHGLFEGDTGLVEILNPKTFLPYKVTEYCYYKMFNLCTHLTNAPELPSMVLEDSCYALMFNGCSKIKYIKMLATDISAEDCLYSWVDGIYSTDGTFVKHPEATWDVRGSSGVPSGWTIKFDGEK